MKGAEKVGENTGEEIKGQEATPAAEPSNSEVLNNRAEQVVGLKGLSENISSRNSQTAEQVGGNLDADATEIAGVKAEIDRIGVQEGGVAQARLAESLEKIRQEAGSDGENPEEIAALDNLIKRVKPSAEENSEVQPDVDWDENSANFDEGDKHIASEGEETQDAGPEQRDDDEKTKIYEEPNLDPAVQKIYEEITARAAKWTQEAQSGKSGAIAQTESRKDPARYSGQMNFLSSRGVWERFAKDYPEKALAYADKNEDIAEGLAASAPRAEKSDGAPKIIPGEAGPEMPAEEDETPGEESESETDKMIQELGLEDASPENPVKMQWANEDGDVEVSVTGVNEEPGADGRTYARAFDEETGAEFEVPLDELQSIDLAVGEEDDGSPDEEGEAQKKEAPTEKEGEDEPTQAEADEKNNAYREKISQERQLRIRDRLERRGKEQAERDEVAVQSITMSLEKASTALAETKADTGEESISKIGPALKLLNESGATKRELAIQLLPSVRAFARNMDKSSSDPTAAETITAQKILGNREAGDQRLQEAFVKINSLNQETDKVSGGESMAYLMKYIVKNSEGKLGNPAQKDDIEAPQAQNDTVEEAEPLTAERPIANQAEGADLGGDEVGDEGNEPGSRNADTVEEPSTAQDGDQEAANPYSDPEAQPDVNWDDNSAEFDEADREIAQSDQTEKTEAKADSGE
ncbi:MAG: hypothetical protein WC227_00875 [Patescibacteria group bacterium]|jgi:hypothetical protein